MKVQHTVTLLHASPLHLAAHGARTCWDSHDKSDTAEARDAYIEESILSGGYATNTANICGTADTALIDRVGNKFRHASILEHLNYCFYIEGISRACLQELSRHRHTSPSVKSTRYTISELRKEESFSYCVADRTLLGNHFRDETDDIFIKTYEHWKSLPSVKRAEKYLVFTDNFMVDVASVKALEILRFIVTKNVSNDKAKYCLPESYKVTEQLTINARSLQNFLSLRSDKSALWEIRQLARSLYDAVPLDHQYLFTHCMKEE